MSTSTVVATLPSTSTVLRSAKGRAVGERYFIGTASASQLRATAKSLGLKGGAIRDYVNKALTDETAARAAGTAAALAALTAIGFNGDTVTVRKHTARIDLVRPTESKPKVSKVAALEAEIAALKAQLASK